MNHLPTFSIPDSVNLGTAEAESFRNAVASFSVGEAAANRFDLTSREFSHTVFRATESGCTPFGVHVGHVIGLRSDKKMPGVATRRVVASMADVQPVNVQTGKVRCDPMREHMNVLPIRLPVDGENTVAVLVNSPAPRPAFVRPSAPNFIPKIGDLPFGQSHGEGLYHHQSLPYLDGAVSIFTAPAALPRRRGQSGDSRGMRACTASKAVAGHRAYRDTQPCKKRT